MLAKDDSPEDHISDTEVAGAGLCDPATTRFVVEHGRQAIEWLIGQGVPFTRDASSDLGYHLTQEGGHRHRRVIHAADATGHAVQTTLEAKIIAAPTLSLDDIDNEAQQLLPNDPYIKYRDKAEITPFEFGTMPIEAPAGEPTSDKSNLMKKLLGVKKSDTTAN